MRAPLTCRMHDRLHLVHVAALPGQCIDHAETLVLLLLSAGLTFRTSSSEASVFIGKRTIKVTHPA